MPFGIGAQYGFCSRGPYHKPLAVAEIVFEAIEVFFVKHLPWAKFRVHLLLTIFNDAFLVGFIKLQVRAFKGKAPRNGIHLIDELTQALSRIYHGFPDHQAVENAIAFRDMARYGYAARFFTPHQDVLLKHQACNVLEADLNDFKGQAVSIAELVDLN